MYNVAFLTWWLVHDKLTLIGYCYDQIECDDAVKDALFIMRIRLICNRFECLFSERFFSYFL